MPNPTPINWALVAQNLKRAVPMIVGSMESAEKLSHEVRQLGFEVKVSAVDGSIRVTKGLRIGGLTDQQRRELEVCK